MGIGELIHYGTVHRGQAEKPLGHHGGKPFGEHCHCRHHSSNVEGVPSVGDHIDVDKHSHSYQEIGDEDGIAYEFKPSHKCGSSGYETVEHKSCKERSEHPFKPYP